MSRSRLIRTLLFVGVFGSGSLAGGQSVVPGGWDAQMGWQAFTLVGYSGASGVFAEGSPLFSLSMTAGMSVVLPYGRSFYPAGGPGHEFQAVNSLIPLSQTIRRQTRRRGGR